VINGPASEGQCFLDSMSTTRSSARLRSPRRQSPRRTPSPKRQGSPKRKLSAEEQVSSESPRPTKRATTTDAKLPIEETKPPKVSVQLLKDYYLIEETVWIRRFVDGWFSLGCSCSSPISWPISGTKQGTLPASLFSEVEVLRHLDSVLQQRLSRHLLPLQNPRQGGQDGIIKNPPSSKRNPSSLLHPHRRRRPPRNPRSHRKDLLWWKRRKLMVRRTKRGTILFLRTRMAENRRTKMGQGISNLNLRMARRLRNRKNSST